MKCEKPIIVDTGVEALYCNALQRPAPYYAKVLEDISNGKGCWDSLRVGIFERLPIEAGGETEENNWSREPQYSEKDRQIGEYKRNYHTPFHTFHPFQLRGNWYALYSKDYTATRLMKLPSCEDIGGEERAECGFCPTDYWVPPLHYIESLHDEGCPRDNKRGHTPDGTKSCTCTIVHEHGCPCCSETRVENGSCTCKEAWSKHYEKYHIWHFPDRIHGFISGCVWGDDGSMKIQFLDLSHADEGVLKREDRFGYIELPDNLTLDKAVHLDVGDGYCSLTIDVQRRFDIHTGKVSEY